MAFDAYLYLDGVTGEATHDKYKGWIELNSFQFGAHQAVNVGASTGMSAGKVSFNPFVVEKHSDKASPKIFLACCNGSHYKDAKIYLQKSGGPNALQYVKFEFNTVYVSKIDWSGGGSGNETPIETIEFVYSGVQITYTPQKVDGTADAAIVAKWDYKAGTGG